MLSVNILKKHTITTMKKKGKSCWIGVAVHISLHRFTVIWVRFLHAQWVSCTYMSLKTKKEVYSRCQISVKLYYSPLKVAFSCLNAEWYLKYTFLPVYYFVFLIPRNKFLDNNTLHSLKHFPPTFNNPVNPLLEMD